MIKLFAKIHLFFACHFDAYELEVDAAQATANVPELMKLKDAHRTKMKEISEEIDGLKDQHEVVHRERVKELKKEFGEREQMVGQIEMTVGNYEGAARQKIQRAEALREKAKFIWK